LGQDYFLNDDFMVSFSNDETENYGVGRSVTLNITAGQAGTYSVEIDNANEVTTSNIITRATISKSYTLAAGETKSVNLTTSTFAEQVSATVTCTTNEGSVSKTVTAAVRNKLNPKVSSAKYNNADVLGTQELGIYTTQTDAQNRTNAVGTVTVSELKAGSKSYTIDGLTASSTVWFSYKESNTIYYIASANANVLNAGTAVLAFTREEIKIANITNITLSGQSNKADRDCTLKFTTDQLGTYTITITEGSNTTTTTKEVTTIGEITISNVYKTTTRYTSITVKIEGVNASVTKEFSRNQW
jgi:hypothetical protein